MEMRIIPLNKDASEAPKLLSLRPIAVISHVIKFIEMNNDY